MPIKALKSILVSRFNNIVSSKFLEYYLALFYWIEKNKDKPYLEQACEIITLLSNQFNKIPLAKFKGKSTSFDLKDILV